MMRSAARACSSCLTLPRMRMSLMPGAAVDTTSIRPLVASLRATFDRACSSRYSSRASSAVMDAGPDAGGQRALAVAQHLERSEGGGQAALALQLDDQDRQTGGRGHPGQRGRYRRLADAPLPGDDDDSRLSAELARIQPIRRLLAALLLSMLASAGLLGAAAAGRGPGRRRGARPVHIIEVKGRIDPIVADFVARSLRSAPGRRRRGRRPPDGQPGGADRRPGAR